MLYGFIHGLFTKGLEAAIIIMLHTVWYLVLFVNASGLLSIAFTPEYFVCPTCRIQQYDSGSLHFRLL